MSETFSAVSFLQMPEYHALRSRLFFNQKCYSPGLLSFSLHPDGEFLIAPTETMF
jgi:hypothetical protein